MLSQCFLPAVCFFLVARCDTKKCTRRTKIFTRAILKYTIRFHLLAGIIVKSFSIGVVLQRANDQFLVAFVVSTAVLKLASRQEQSYPLR
jgi:hypothetical protein